jgi:hypothetical protein
MFRFQSRRILLFIQSLRHFHTKFATLHLIEIIYQTDKRGGEFRGDHRLFICLRELEDEHEREKEDESSAQERYY